MHFFESKFFYNVHFCQIIACQLSQASSNIFIFSFALFCQGFRPSNSWNIDIVKFILILVFHLTTSIVFQQGSEASCSHIMTSQSKFSSFFSFLITHTNQHNEDNEEVQCLAQGQFNSPNLPTGRLLLWAMSLLSCISFVKSFPTLIHFAWTCTQRAMTQIFKGGSPWTMQTAV